MSDRVAIIPEAVLQSKAWANISGGAKTVLVALYLHAGRDGRCWPSKQTIGYWAGNPSHSTVTRALAELETAELITRSRNRGGRSETGEGITTIYQLVTPTGAMLRPLPDHNGRTGEPAKGRTGVPVEGAQSCTQGAQSCTKNGRTGEPEKDTGKGAGNSARCGPDGWESARQHMSLGSALNTDDFRRAWQDWTDHRRAIGKRPALTEQAIKRQIRQLEQIGHERAIVAIDHSIFKNWQGIYEPDRRQQPAPQDSPSGYTSPAEILEAVLAGRVRWARLNGSGWIDLGRATAYSDSGLKADGQVILKTSDVPKAEIQ